MKPIQLSLVVGPDAVSALVDQMHRVVTERLPSEIESSVAQALEKHKPPTVAEEPKATPTKGVSMIDQHRIEARELRDAYLLGKLPDDGGLLIDIKQVSKLLSVSHRTVMRLVQLKVVPDPIRIGTLLKWRLREIIEWVEEGCPPQRFWRYSKGEGRDTRKRR